MVGFVSCAWEVRDSLLEEETARTNPQKPELQGTSEVGHTQLQGTSEVAFRV